MTTKDILVKALEVITFLFAACSGFLKTVAPPEDANSSFAVGISSLLALAVLLFISAVSKNQVRSRYKKYWLAMSLALFLVSLTATFLYKANLDALTFSYPPGNPDAEFVGGTELTSDAQRYRADHPEKTISEILGDYGGLSQRDLVWTAESIHRARLKLTANYVVLVLALAACIFCLTEGILVEPPKGEAT